MILDDSRCSQVEHHTLGIGHVAEQRRIWPAEELRTPVEILAGEPRNAVARVDEDERDAPSEEKPTERTSKPHEVVHAASVCEERERQRDGPPSDPPARAKDEWMPCRPVIADDADASVARVVAQ